MKNECKKETLAMEMLREQKHKLNFYRLFTIVLVVIYIVSLMLVFIIRRPSLKNNIGKSP